jgi:hypothetical protein
MSLNHILIRSTDRKFSTESSHCFLITLPFTIEGTYKLTNCLIPNLFYNLRDTNNIIYLTENSIEKSTTLSPGNYSASVLATVIKVQLDATSAGYNILGKLKVVFSVY